MSDISVSEYIDQQKALEDEARGLMPWNPTHCTYTDGALRQPVFACLDCGKIGVCYSCSIQCHAECQLEELFTKRGFTCDCGTERQQTKKGQFWCQLRQNKDRDIPSLSNHYSQNFEGLFCNCHNKYNPDSDSTMIQCVLGLECNEEWYHLCCIMKDHDHSPSECLDSSQQDQIPDGFPSLDSFDSFICWKCVSQYHSVFQRLMASPLAERLIAHRIKHCVNPSSPKVPSVSSNDSKKRKVDSSEEECYSIMLRTDYKDTLAEIKKNLQKTDQLFVFLDGIAPFLILDDPVYEPPEDSDDDASTFELGTKALTTSVDRNVAVAGIQAMDKIKKKLSEFLRPFAESGEVVKEEDIKNFFDKHRPT